MSAAPHSQGRFITLEGGEGVGKSTQATLLAKRLGKHGLTVVTTREPGGTPGGEAIRSLLTQGAIDRWDGISELLLLLAARRRHVVELIEPALRRGDWVVCDRFADSTMAYQGYAMGLDRALIDRLHEAVIERWMPDLTLILDLPLDVGLARAAMRDPAGSRYEAMDRAFHDRVRDGFLKIAARNPDRCRVVDASGTSDDVAARIESAVGPLLEDENG